MGTKYATTSVSGYNATPPADDGSQTATNQLFWSTFKTKLGDPLNTFAAAIDPKITTALDTSVRQITTSDSSVAGDHIKTIVIASTVSTGITVSLGDAATMAAGYMVTVNNQCALGQTIGRVTSANSINGTVANVSIPSLSSMTFKVNSALTGYIVDSVSLPQSKTTVASAAAPDIWTGTGNLIDYTGTATATSFAAAPQAGTSRELLCAGAAVFTNGANFIVAGGDFTAAAGDRILCIADTTTKFRLYPLKASGIGLLGGRLLAKSGTAVSCPVDATEDTLATISVPANAMGANGFLKITLNTAVTNNANTKTLRVKFGGTTVGSWNLAAIDQAQITGTINNANATGTQTAYLLAAYSANSFTSQFGAVASIDTTSAVTLLITGQKATAGDTMTLKNYLIEIVSDGT